jgi:RimJ/RimL family protein N-acetyltransferase
VIVSPPRVETSRLVLRGWQASDFEAHAAMCADPEVMRYVGELLDRQQSWRQMAMHSGHWALRGCGNWAVERRSDGVLLGRVGLWNPEGWPGLEVGWMLARHAWGNGYATEAGRAAMDWAWEVLDTPQLISVIHPQNAGSIRVAERLGLRRLREGTIGDERVVIFGIERPVRRDAVAAGEQKARRQRLIPDRRDQA